MQRNVILQGDRTTSDGVVEDGDTTTNVNGKGVSYVGARVSCPRCHSEGQIVAVGPRWPMGFLGEKDVALEHDLCVCKCNPHPRLVASQSMLYQTLDGHAQRQAGAVGAAVPPEAWSFIAFKVADPGSLEGMRCIAHFDDGSTASGIFNRQNMVRFEQPSGTVCNRVTLDTGSDTTGTFAGAFLSTMTA